MVCQCKWLKTDVCSVVLMNKEATYPYLLFALGELQTSVGVWPEEIVHIPRDMLLTNLKENHTQFHIDA